MRSSGYVNTTDVAPGGARCSSHALLGALRASGSRAPASPPTTSRSQGFRRCLEGDRKSHLYCSKDMNCTPAYGNTLPTAARHHQRAAHAGAHACARGSTLPPSQSFPSIARAGPPPSKCAAPPKRRHAGRRACPRLGTGSWCDPAAQSPTCPARPQCRRPPATAVHWWQCGSRPAFASWCASAAPTAAPPLACPAPQCSSRLPGAVRSAASQRTPVRCCSTPTSCSTSTTKSSCPSDGLFEADSSMASACLSVTARPACIRRRRRRRRYRVSAPLTSSRTHTLVPRGMGRAAAHLSQRKLHIMPGNHA